MGFKKNKHHWLLTGSYNMSREAKNTNKMNLLCLHVSKAIYYCFSMTLIATSTLFSTMVIYISNKSHQQPVPHFFNKVSYRSPLYVAHFSTEYKMKSISMLANSAKSGTWSIKHHPSPCPCHTRLNFNGRAQLFSECSFLHLKDCMEYTLSNDYSREFDRPIKIK
jgi:hypothetical protein